MKLSHTITRIIGRKPEYCAAILVAAGTSSRMEGQDKVLAPLGGMTVIERAALAFEENELISELVVVTRSDLLEEVSKLLYGRGLTKLTAVTVGGATRTESVLAGLAQVSKKTRLAAVHDAARPLVSQRVITETVRKAAATRASAPALAVKDTVKLADKHIVTETPERRRLFAVQTPQVFDYDLLCAALQKAAQDGLSLTDDCQAVEHLGMNVFLTHGEEANLKITTPFDLRVAALFLEDEA